MLTVKQDLLAVLAESLEALVPGAGAKAAFESPKVAAHGDFACTAAMQLAKPLKKNPRQLGEELRTALLAQPAYVQWVDAIEIAGPGFLNIRLKPAAKQQVVREVLVAGEAYGRQPATGEKVLVEFVRPTRPAHCMWATAARRRWVMPSATCAPRRAMRCTASSITTTPAFRFRRWPEVCKCVPGA